MDYPTTWIRRKWKWIISDTAHKWIGRKWKWTASDAAPPSLVEPDTWDVLLSCCSNTNNQPCWFLRSTHTVGWCPWWLSVVLGLSVVHLVTSPTPAETNNLTQKTNRYKTPPCTMHIPNLHTQEEFPNICLPASSRYIHQSPPNRDWVHIHHKYPLQWRLPHKWPFKLRLVPIS